MLIKSASYMLADQASGSLHSSQMESLTSDRLRSQASICFIFKYLITFPTNHSICSSIYSSYSHDFLHDSFYMASYQHLFQYILAPPYLIDSINLPLGSHVPSLIPGPTTRPRFSSPPGWARSEPNPLRGVFVTV